MKKLAITFSLLIVAAGAFAQGTISVNNTTTTLFRTNAVAEGGTEGVAFSATGPGFYYELLTAPSTVTAVDPMSLLSPVWSDTGLSAQNTTIPGRMSSSNLTVNNWAIGTIQSFVFVGWSGNLGNTWPQVAAEMNGAYFDGGKWVGSGFPITPNFAFLGATSVGWVEAGGVVGSTTYPTSVAFGTVDSASGTPIITPTELYVIGTPEPASFGLAGLGAALMIFRRRKA
jgi:hypothetical protein